MKAIYVRPGSTFEFVASADLAREDLVVLPTGVGVAQDAIPAGGKGLVHVVGVFAVPKDPTEAIASGAVLYLDEANSRVTATQGGLTVKAGVAAAPAAASAPTVDMRLEN